MFQGYKWRVQDVNLPGKNYNKSFQCSFQCNYIFLVTDLVQVESRTNYRQAVEEVQISFNLKRILHVKYYLSKTTEALATKINLSIKVSTQYHGKMVSVTVFRSFYSVKIKIWWLEE